MQQASPDSTSRPVDAARRTFTKTATQHNFHLLDHTYTNRLKRKCPSRIYSRFFELLLRLLVFQVFTFHSKPVFFCSKRQWTRSLLDMFFFHAAKLNEPQTKKNGATFLFALLLITWREKTVQRTRALLRARHAHFLQLLFSLYTRAAIE